MTTAEIAVRPKRYAAPITRIIIVNKVETTGLKQDKDDKILVQLSCLFKRRIELTENADAVINPSANPTHALNASKYT